MGRRKVLTSMLLISEVYIAYVPEITTLPGCAEFAHFFFFWHDHPLRIWIKKCAHFPWTLIGRSTHPSSSDPQMNSIVLNSSEFIVSNLDHISAILTSELTCSLSSSSCFSLSSLARFWLSGMTSSSTLSSYWLENEFHQLADEDDSQNLGSFENEKNNW